MYVPFFRCESFPYISRRADWFHCALFPCHSPCTPLVLISVPVMSLSVPHCLPFISRCFPDMWTSYFLPSFPCTSFISPLLPSISRKKTLFSSVFAKRASKNTECFQFLSLHFLAFPLGSPVFSTKAHTVFPAFSQRGHPKTQSFPDFLQKQAENPNQQKPAGGIEPGTPVFPHRLPEDYV